MRWLLVIVVLSASPARAEDQREDFPDGTLLFVENCNSIVEWRTKSEVAHVALLFHDGSDAWVYEATPGKVHRVLLGDYLTELSRLNRGEMTVRKSEYWGCSRPELTGSAKLPKCAPFSTSRLAGAIR